MWERGVHEFASRRPLAWVGVAAALGALVLVTALTGRAEDSPALGFGAAARGGERAAERAAATEPSGEPGTAHATADPDATAQPEATADPRAPAQPAFPVRPEHLYTLDGSDPEAHPTERTALAFLELDDPVEAAYHEFGPPHRQQADLNDTVANVWVLPGEGELAAVAAGADPGDPVVGLVAEVPGDSNVRLAAHGGVVVGRSTPAEVAEAWGTGDRSQHPGDDFVLRYTLCRGPWPVVIKFDQPDGEAWSDAPVTRILIAYTDDDPASAGCPAP